jgi:hypothetical protein
VWDRGDVDLDSRPQGHGRYGQVDRSGTETVVGSGGVDEGVTKPDLLDHGDLVGADQWIADVLLECEQAGEDLLTDREGVGTVAGTAVTADGLAEPAVAASQHDTGQSTSTVKVHSCGEGTGSPPSNGARSLT